MQKVKCEQDLCLKRIIIKVFSLAHNV